MLTRKLCYRIDDRVANRPVFPGTSPISADSVPRPGLSLSGTQDVPYFGLSIAFASNTSIHIKYYMTEAVSRQSLLRLHTLVCLQKVLVFHRICSQEITGYGRPLTAIAYNL